jgi:hypothetical protein
LTESVVYGVVPGASSVRGRFPKEFFRGRDTPGASTVFFNKNNAFTLSFPSPPLSLHDFGGVKKSTATRRLTRGEPVVGQISASGMRFRPIFPTMTRAKP